MVADSGLMTKKNVQLLQTGKYKYILGARIRNEAKEIREWILSQEKEENTQTLFLTDEQRAIKPLFDLKRYFG